MFALTMVTRMLIDSDRDVVITKTISVNFHVDRNGYERDHDDIAVADAVAATVVDDDDGAGEVDE